MMGRRAILAVLTLAMVTGLGCAFGEFRPHDPMGRELRLEEVQRRYTAYIRWGKFEQASVYVHADVRGDFLDNLPDKDLRITDFEIPTLDLNDNLNQATIEVKYYAYHSHSPFEFSLTETQEWEREGREWSVRPSFGDLNRRGEEPEGQ